jgi:uncharacterized glyoxalase superfamily protein PhnB
MPMKDGPYVLASGKLCYLEIPATDPRASADFYRDAFGFHLRERDNGSMSFDDTVYGVSGSWVTGRPPHTTPGLMIYVMVADLTAALERARTAGGEVLSRSDSDASERIASVRDPAGNVIGVYEQPGLAEAESKLSPIPEHLQAVTPRLAVPDAMSALDFYTRAFGAELLGEPFCDPVGKLIHAELQIGDSVVLLTDDDGYRALLSTYWEDVDAAWGRAIAAGAKVIYSLADQFYGERGGRLEDPYGQQWMLSARTEQLTTAEIHARAAGAQ